MGDQFYLLVVRKGWYSSPHRFDGKKEWKESVYAMTNMNNIPKGYVSFMPLNMFIHLTREGWDLEGDEGIPPN